MRGDGLPGHQLRLGRALRQLSQAHSEPTARPCSTSKSSADACGRLTLTTRDRLATGDRWPPGMGGHAARTHSPATPAEAGDHHGHGGHTWPPMRRAGQLWTPRVAHPWRALFVLTGLVGWAVPRASRGWLLRAKPAHQTACNRPAASVGGTDRTARLTEPRRGRQRPRRHPRVPRPRKRRI
jgi:hypothetical protein